MGSDREKWKEAVLKLVDPDQFPESYGGTCPDTKKIYVARDGTFKYTENQNEPDQQDYLHNNDLNESSSQIIMASR